MISAYVLRFSCVADWTGVADLIPDVFEAFMYPSGWRRFSMAEGAKRQCSDEPVG